jgi:hypothetical protein
VGRVVWFYMRRAEECLARMLAHTSLTRSLVGGTYPTAFHVIPVIVPQRNAVGALRFRLELVHSLRRLIM